MKVGAIGASAALVGLFLLVAACSGGDTMVAAPPPTGWADDILAWRAAKDREFRWSSDTPLRPEDRSSFEGLAYWPPDPAYRFGGWLTPHANPERLTVITTSGQQRPCERVGYVTFTVDGASCRLQVYRLLDQDRRAGGEGLFLPFMDATTGQETYPAGRYVELDGPEGGPYVLDFNRAYNPLCAYGMAERFQCPVTPRENRLPVRIEAGERGYSAYAAEAR